MSNSKHSPSLGILGLGSRSTLFYIEQLNRQYNNAIGGDSTCPLLLLNSDFNRFNPYLPNQFSQLEPALVEYLDIFSRIGIQQLLLPNITLHESYDRLSQQQTQGINVVHPVLSTIERLKKDGVTEIILFGSRHSMLSTVLQSHFTQAGISVAAPKEEDISAIDNIRQQVYAEKESTDDIDNFHRLISNYQESSTVVIACTELSVIQTIESPGIYDMAYIQIDKFITKALQP